MGFPTLLIELKGRAMLTTCIAAYPSEVHEWEAAIDLWGSLQQDRLMAAPILTQRTSDA